MRDQAIGKQRDIEPQVRRVLIDVLFLGRQQVDQQRREARALERTRDELVARAVAAAAAAVREQHETCRGAIDDGRQVAPDRYPPRGTLAESVIDSPHGLQT